MLLQNASNCNRQRTDIVLDHFPGELEVHSEILVDQDIASTGDIPSWGVRVLLQEEGDDFPEDAGSEPWMEGVGCSYVNVSLQDVAEIEAKPG
jgi:hypothetical protein